MEPVIAVNGLGKRYGDQLAVDDVTFDVRRNEIFGILGPNGAGKTTSVECIQGLREPDKGTISILGLDPRHDHRELRRRTGCQLQHSALPDKLKVWEALDLFASVSPAGIDWRTLLDDWGLSDKRNAAFGSLSGGQQQRLFIALALVSEPEIVFLDEMTTGLDPAARRVAWGLIEAIRDRGTTVVLVTHFMDEAERLCDRLAVIDRGRVVALDTPQRLIAEHPAGVRVLFTSTRRDLSWLDGVRGVQTVKRRGPEVEIEGTGAVLVHVAAELKRHRMAPVDLRVERPTLEDVFLHLTTPEEVTS